MAATALQVPSSNYIIPGSHILTNISFPEPVDTAHPDAEAVATEWVSSFNDFAKSGASGLSTLFLKESYWRDLLCLTWDFHTFQGPEKIKARLKSQDGSCRIKALTIDDSSSVGRPQVSAIDFEGKLKGIRSFLTVDTDVGRGRGLIRLLPDPGDQGKWKAFTLFTTLQELKGSEELIRERRPTGVEHDIQSERKNWKERRLAEENCNGFEPTVLIIGEPLRHTSTELA